MAFGLGEAVLNITADVGDFNAALGKAESKAKRSFGNIASGAKTMGLGMMAVGGSVLAGLGLATKAYATQEQAELQLQARLKSTQGAAGMTEEALLNLASGLQSVTTYGDEAIINGEAMLLTFTKIGQDVFPQATEIMLDMSTAMNQGIKESAVQLGKALNDPIKGVTALSRVGVQFTEEQRAQIEAMVEMGDVAGAQKLILAELQTQFGGAARAAAEGTGKIKQLKNTFGDMVEQIGGAVVPVLIDLSETLMPIVEGVINWTKANPELTGTIVKWSAAIAGVVTVGGGLLFFLGTASTGILSILNLIGVVGGAGVLGAFGLWAGAIVGVAVAGYQLGGWINDMIDKWLPGLASKIDWASEKLYNFTQRMLQVIGLAEKIPSQDEILGGRSKELLESGQLPGFAEGTNYHRGGLAIVGERGPELADLPIGTRVHSNQDTISMIRQALSGSSGGGQITNYINTGLSETRLKELMNGMATTRRRYAT